MRSFDEIYDISKKRHGDALDEQIGNLPKSAKALAKVPADRWLSMFSKVIFQAGFNWKVVENKWDDIEEAFKGFDIAACAFMPEDWFEALTKDTRIIRYPAKIRAVQENAQFIQSLEDRGGVGKVIADWPATEFADLIAFLKKDGTRLGGTTGQYALRMMGRDGYILARDVVGRLVAEGVIDKDPTSKKAMVAVQDAFNTWMDQSGKSLTEISRVLALSL